MFISQKVTGHTPFFHIPICCSDTPAPRRPKWEDPTADTPFERLVVLHLMTGQPTPSGPRTPPQKEGSY